MAKYNSMHDIPYLKFLQFSQEIAEHSEDLVLIADKVIEHFYPEVTENEALYVEEFWIALQNNPKRFFPYWFVLGKLNKFDNFIDAENFKDDKDYESLLKLILRPLWWFGKVDVNKVSLSDGQKAMSFFLTICRKSRLRFNTFLINQLQLQLKR